MNLQGITFESAFWSYVGQTAAFSIGLLLIGRTSNRILLWLVANVLGVVGVFFMGASAPTGHTPLFSALLNVTAVLIRGFSVSSGNLLSARNRVGTLSATLSTVSIALMLPLGNSEFRGLLVVLGSITGLMAGLFFLAADRRSRGLAGTWQMQAINVVLILAMSTQLTVVFPFGEEVRLFNNPQRSAFGATALVILGTVWQIAFFSLVTGRNARAGIIATRRATRLEERSLLLRTRLDLTRDLANERLNLLRMMSHEIRQPLNNAQAALQSLVEQRPSRAAERTTSITTASHIQGILDDVILAISNSIIAASIIEWRRNPAILPVSACNTLDLAALDCSPEDYQRIDFTRCEEDVFLYADPALLRLALRNLLANALKYSPQGSRVLAAVELDEKRRGLAFQISNAVADPASLQGRLFERGVRGAGNDGEGSGLGLFMVSETARLHHGTVACWQLTPGHVTFELFIPA